MQTRIGLRIVKSRNQSRVEEENASNSKASIEEKQQVDTTSSSEQDPGSSTILKRSPVLNQTQKPRSTKRRSTRLISKQNTPADSNQRTILEAFTSHQDCSEDPAPTKTIPEKRQASCEYPSPETEEAKKIKLHTEHDDGINGCIIPTKAAYATPVEEKQVLDLSENEKDDICIRSKRLKKEAPCFEDLAVDGEHNQQGSMFNDQMEDFSTEHHDDNEIKNDTDHDETIVEQKPWKALIYENDRARIADECNTLKSLRKALDILLTFYAGNKRMALFHKITPVLRNSTRRNITLGHMCKILYLTPDLYKLEPQVITEYVANIETYSVEVGGKWKTPLDGKSLEERETLLASKLEEYFEKHNEPHATVPEKELPKSMKVVDKKEWLQTAKIPERVREILLLQEQRKEEAKKETEQPKPEPKGSVKDRRQALLERIRAKSQKK